MIEAEARGGWKDLEAKLRPFVARRVPGADAEDVLQDVLFRVARGLAGLRDDQRFGPWVYQVAKSAIADHQRAAARRAIEAPADVAEVPAAEAEDEDVAEALARYLAPFVTMLPSPYREALTLVELEGLTQREAAEMAGISLSGMKSRVQRGRALLRQALEACCDIALDVRGRVVACDLRPDGRLPNGNDTGAVLAAPRPGRRPCR